MMSAFRNFSTWISSNLKSIIVAVILLIVMVGLGLFIASNTNIAKKDKYVDEFELFLKEVRVLHDDFTDEEWDNFHNRYNELVDEKKQHAKYFNLADEKKIKELEDEYQEHRVEENIDNLFEKTVNKIGDFIGGISDAINEGLSEDVDSVEALDTLEIN